MIPLITALMLPTVYVLINIFNAQIHGMRVNKCVAK